MADTSVKSEAIYERLFVVLNGLLVLGMVATWVQLAVEGQFWRGDFTAFYVGWSMAHDGAGDQLYNLDLQTLYYHRTIPSEAGETSLLAYMHPPHSVLLFGKLAWLPFWPAFYAWTALQVGLCILACWYVRALTPDGDVWTKRVVLITLLAFPPMFITFQLGQTALFSLVCLLGFVWGVKHNRPWTVALCLTLATVKPQLVLVPVVFLIATGRWRELGLSVTLLVPWVALTGFMLGWGVWPAFAEQLRQVANQFGGFGVKPLVMYNLKSVLTAALGAERAGLINALSGLAMLSSLAATFFLWRGVRSTEGDFDLRMALTLLVGLVCNPHFNPADVLLLAAPAVLLHAHLRRNGFSLSVIGPLLALCPLLFLVDVFRVGQLAGGFRPFVAVELALITWSAWLLWSRGGQRIVTSCPGSSPPQPIPGS
jgi:alpha-1,2-mannosyltransferase